MAENREIIEAVLGGKRDRYGELVERYGDRAQAIACRYLGDVQAAEDLAQEGFIKAFVSLRTLAKPEAFGAWLARITRNLCRSALRKQSIATEPLENHSEKIVAATKDPRRMAGEKQAGELLREALDQIPPKAREAVVLYYLKEQTISQIAEFLGVSENAVKQHLHRGRVLLRKRFEKFVLDEGRENLKLSEHFLAGVMVALPIQPLKLSAVGAFF